MFPANPHLVPGGMRLSADEVWKKAIAKEGRV